MYRQTDGGEVTPMCQTVYAGDTKLRHQYLRRKIQTCQYIKCDNLCYTFFMSLIDNVTGKL